MSVFKRRTRIVSFRLSEDEYERLRGTCVSHGIRSISDFARFATQQWVDNDTEPVLVTIRELKGKVRELDLELRELAGKVPRAGVGK